MSGHSKWSTIKRQKGVTDARRGAVFTKLANSITIAVREGGSGDPDSNFKLRLAIDKARQANMPKENIQRAIGKGLGKGEGSQLENAVYEGFGPAGIAVIVEVISDNTTRTGSQLRNFFEKSGGHLGSSGTVSYLFKQEGEITLSISSDLGPLNLDKIFDKAAEAGAEDVEESPEGFLVYTKPEDLHKIRQNLEAAGLSVTGAELVYRPNKEAVAQVDSSKEQGVRDFLENLADLDDVQNVYANVNFN